MKWNSEMMILADILSIAITIHDVERPEKVIRIELEFVLKLLEGME